MKNLLQAEQSGKAGEIFPGLHALKIPRTHPDGLRRILLGQPLCSPKRGYIPTEAGTALDRTGLLRRHKRRSFSKSTSWNTRLDLVRRVKNPLACGGERWGIQPMKFAAEGQK